MNVHWKRTLRTSNSERFLGIENGTEIAAADIHYLSNGQVAGTMILLEQAAPGGTWTEKLIMEVMRSLDDGYLPEVDVDAGNLNYTVVVGNVLGNYEGASDATRA